MDQILSSILSPKCVEVYFTYKDYFNLDCSKLLLSRLVGYLILCFALGGKLPQISKIYKGKSGRGINITTQVILVLCLCTEFSYSYISGYPFTTFGDAVCNFVQTNAIVYLCIYYSGQKTRAAFTMMLIFSGAVLLCSGVVPLYILKKINQIGFLLKFFAVSIQIRTNYKNKSTGQISFASMAIALSIVSTKAVLILYATRDYQLATGVSLSVLPLATLVFQIWYYSEKVQATKKTE